MSAHSAARAVDLYLDGGTQPELAAGGLRAVLLSLLGAPPVAGARFRSKALSRLRAATDQELRELFGDESELRELLAVLSARIPRGDPELDEFIGRLFRGSWRVVGTSVVTRSGFYLPGGPALDDARAADEVAAAAWFPSLTGAKVWHLHLDPQTGHVLAGDEALAPEQFYDALLAGRGWAPETLLVIVGCGAAAAATAPGASESLAQVLAQRGGGPVLAADTDAWTTPEGEVLAAPAEVDEEGRPWLGTRRGNWVLVARNGDQSDRLGPDLLGILRDGTPPAA